MTKTVERMTRAELIDFLGSVALQHGDTADTFCEHMDRLGEARVATSDGEVITATLVSVGGPRIYRVVLAASDG